MAWRFRFPTVSRRQSSLGLAVFVLLAGAAYVYLRMPQPCCAPQPIDAEIMGQFQNFCVKAARHASGGGDLVMDDATEAKIGDYCTCVADGLQQKIPPMEVARIADGTQSDKTMQTLDAIIGDCRPKLQ
jgi:hypothetical protein